METNTKKQPIAKQPKPSNAGNKQKVSTSSTLKWPIETSTKKQSSTKWFKPPLAEQLPSGNMSPLVRGSVTTCPGKYRTIA
jgi:hypothetical protein